MTAHTRPARVEPGSDTITVVNNGLSADCTVVLFQP